ncbi:RHS repeat-associated core domain-containing protein [Roseateles sp. 22389]|uniref:RHS repeat-associated core domain-containing protein n=1 Tax=Roseateles sp. 22389 TaxID=3453916 RepID=UPI003F873ECF
MNYNYFRDYDGTTGRYVQSGPLGLARGVNTYSYVDGNPLGYTDSMGLAPDVRVCVNGIYGPPPPPVWNPYDPRPAPAPLPDLTKPSPYLPTWNWDGITWPSWMESRRSDKERATDIPSWSKQHPRKPEESCAKYAEQILNEHYGCDDPRSKDRGPGSEYSKIKKHYERGGK